VPLVQRLEQQSALPLHWLPSVLHVPPPPSDAHVPPEHVWLQQSPLTTHWLPSELHAG
jgi:hypothetical protein